LEPDGMIGQAQGAAARRYRWVIFAMLSLCYVLVNFHRLCPAVLAVDLMNDLSAGGMLAGLLSSTYFYAYALMQLPAGALADSWGPRKTMSLFFIIAAAGSLMLGMASTVSVAMIGRTLVGLGVGMVFVPTMKILTRWFHAREFSIMASVFLAMGGLGTLSAATPLVFLNDRIGWRSTFWVVGFLTLALAVGVFTLVRNRPADFGWSDPYPAMPGETQTQGRFFANARMVLTDLRFWPVAIWFFCNVGVFFAIGGLWGGPYLQQVYHMDEAQAGRILSTIALGLVLGNPLFSVVAEHVVHRRKAVMVVTSTVMVGLMGVFAMNTDGLSVPSLYVLFFLFSIFSNAVAGIGFTLNKELFPVAMAGTATGLVNLFPFAGGAFFQPVVGRILESFGLQNGMFTLSGYKAAFYFLWAASGIALLACVCIRENRHGESR
jgi:sugar phosphate permease